MIERIEHIGVAVEDLGIALDFYQGALGLAATEVEEVPNQKVRVAVLPVGDSKIELLEPTSPDSTVAHFIEKRGEGVHHLCFEVPNIEEALATLREAGARLIDEKPRPGAGGRRIAFVHPRSSHGVLIELSERPANSRQGAAGPPDAQGRLPAGEEQ